MVSNSRYGIDRVIDTGSLTLTTSPAATFSRGSHSDCSADLSIYASSPASYDDFRRGGVRVALSEVCEPCGLPVFGDEEESGRLLCVCVDGLVVPLLSVPVGDLEGGGPATCGCGGAKDRV